MSKTDVRHIGIGANDKGIGNINQYFDLTARVLYLSDILLYSFTLLFYLSTNANKYFILRTTWITIIIFKIKWKEGKNK